MTRVNYLAAGVMCLLSLTMVGCGAMAEKANELKLKNDLSELALAYHNYHDAHGQGPANWDELIKENSGSAEAIQRVRDAGYQVKWGVKLRDLTEGASNTVMAEKPDGGPKLMFDMTVR